MQQLSLLQYSGQEYVQQSKKTLTKSKIGDFSHNSVCDETARLALEELYFDIIQETNKFSRKTVSFQSNKVQALHNWVHYREGFSSELVELLMDELGVTEKDIILDPFAGSCTTLLQAMLNNYRAIGIELLPHCHLAWQAKSRVFDYDIEELRRVKHQLATETPPASGHSFPHLAITQSAFPKDVEQEIVDYAYWVDNLNISVDSKLLLRALIMSVLESVSYTRKDGQYLRWDGRAAKIVQRNKKRIAQNKKPFRGINKGVLPTFKNALMAKLNAVIRDVRQLQSQEKPTIRDQQLIAGNTLFTLPTMASDSISAVITSPPYANRYDYTRTYALELAFLGVESEIFSLRQGLLSCTVENKSKAEKLKLHYQSIEANKRYAATMQIIDSCEVLQEVNVALRTRNARGEINNKGVLRMIEQYFIELAFVFVELYRVCKAGGQVVFVNDNVRYAGEVIPVDTISTRLAQTIGFEPQVIHVIPQRKGNSSQRMKRFGRRELRKSITIWKKPIQETV